MDEESKRVNPRDVKSVLPPEYGADNKIFTNEMADRARERLLEKLYPNGTRENENDNEELEKDSPELFGFLIEDQGLIFELVISVRMLLKRPDITGEHIAHIGKLVFALERLPLPTPGVDIDLTLSYRVNEELSYMSLYLDETSFHLSRGGSVYDPAVGSDSYSNSDFEVEVGGFRSDADLISVSDWSDGFRRRALDQESNISIEYNGDDTEIPWDEELEENYWENLDSDYAF